MLVKDKELYNFCKQDSKRLYFIIERIYKEKKGDFNKEYSLL
ncbi:plasmid partition family protein [Borreliella bavariensis]|nr:plasmid partition family protein [Borreliella bavariensis]